MDMMQKYDMYETQTGAYDYDYGYADRCPPMDPIVPYGDMEYIYDGGSLELALIKIYILNLYYNSI